MEVHAHGYKTSSYQLTNDLHYRSSEAADWSKKWDLVVLSRRRVRVFRRLCWAPKLVCSTLWYPYRTYLNTKLIGTPEVHPRWAVSPGPPDPGLAKMGASCWICKMWISYQDYLEIPSIGFSFLSIKMVVSKCLARAADNFWFVSLNFLIFWFFDFRCA